MVVVQAWLCRSDTNTTRILDQVSRLAEKGCLLLLFSVIIAVSFRDRHQLLQGSFTKEIFSFCMHAMEDTFDDDHDDEAVGISQSSFPHANKDERSKKNFSILLV